MATEITLVDAEDEGIDEPQTIDDIISTPSTSKQTQSVASSSATKQPVPTTATPVNLSTPGPSTLPTISGIIPKIHNVVASVDLCCQLDLIRIGLRTRNSEYNPRRFHALVMRLLEPRTAAIVFATGKIVVVGAKSESLCHLAARKYARIIQKLGFDVKFKNFRTHNIVATCDVRFPIQIERLYTNQVQFCNYEPELFPGLIYRMLRPKVSILVFVSGKIVLSGAKSMAQLNDAFENIYPLLRNFRKQ